MAKYLIGIFLGFILASCSSKDENVSILVTEVNLPVLQENFTSQLSIDTGYTQGVSAVDVNNDGFTDLYVTNSWTYDNNYFYINENGIMTKADEVISNDCLCANGCTWADFNGDGNVDLAVANMRNFENGLYQNLSSSGFKKLNLGTNKIDENWSYGVSWVDVDNDSDLDLYVSNYYGQKNILYLNNNGVLIKETGVLEVEGHYSISAIWTDLNNDQKQDVIICGENGVRIFVNEGSLIFTKLADEDQLFSELKCYGCSAADYNNDGNMDLFFANWDQKNLLVKNEGNLSFNAQLNIGISDLERPSEGSCWGDFDGDGWTDLIVTNDGPNEIYKNQGGSKFIPVHIPGLTDTIRNSNGTVWFDQDNDGDLDLYVANGGNQRNQYFENTGNLNNWIKIKLEGEGLNKSAIGAKVQVTVDGIVQTQEVSSQTGGGCGSQKPLTLLFGLGRAKSKPNIQVTWPDGEITECIDARLNSTLVVKQNQ